MKKRILDMKKSLLYLYFVLNLNMSYIIHIYIYTYIRIHYTLGHGETVRVLREHS